MKNSLVRFAAFATLALLVTPAGAQTAPPAAAQSTVAQSRDIARGEVTWTRGEFPELAAARARLAVLQQRYRSEHPEMIELREQIEGLERRAAWVLSFDFPGGSLTKFLVVISKANVVSFNIVNAGDPSDLATELPPFSLRNADLGTVIGVVGRLLDPRGFELKHVGGDSPNPSEAKSVVCVLTKRPGATVVNPAPPTLFDSFFLKPYLARQSIDDIVDAIRAGWELNPAHDRGALQLKYHPATSILLVSGPPEAMMVVGKVISQIMKTPEVDSLFVPRKTPPEAAKR